MRIRLTERKALVILGLFLLLEGGHIMLQSNGEGFGLEVRASVLWWFVNAEAVAHIAFGLLCLVATAAFPRSLRLVALAIVAATTVVFGIVATTSPMHPRVSMAFEMGTHLATAIVGLAALTIGARTAIGDIKDKLGKGEEKP